MPERPLPPGLHVILGDSAAGTFLSAFRPPRGRLDIDRDVLSCGPTRACGSLEEWETMRSRFWATCTPGDPQDSFPEPRPGLGIPDRARALREAPQVTLWVGTGLSEQLSATLTLQLGDAGVSAEEKFWIVQFE